MKKSFLATACFLALLTSCNSQREPPPATTKAEGVVLDAKGKPYTGGGAIEFRHTAKDGVRSNSEIKPDGTFLLHTITSQQRVPGAQEGPHEVTIIPASPDQSIKPFVLRKNYTIAPGDNYLKIQLED